MQDKESLEKWARGEAERTKAAQRIAVIVESVAGVEIEPHHVTTILRQHWRLVATAAHIIHGPVDVETPPSPALTAEATAMKADLAAIMDAARALQARVEQREASS